MEHFHKTRDKAFKGSGMDRKSGDYCKLTKKYQMLNHAEKSDSNRRVHKNSDSGISSGHYFRKG